MLARCAGCCTLITFMLSCVRIYWLCNYVPFSWFHDCGSFVMIILTCFANIARICIPFQILCNCYTKAIKFVDILTACMYK